MPKICAIPQLVSAPLNPKKKKKINYIKLIVLKLKQLVHVPTRGDRTLDLIITNMPQFSKEEFLQIFSPFGLSDHSVVLLEPILKSKRTTSSRRLITRRDTRSSRKCELGRCLGSIDWSVLDSDTNCESKLQLFQDLVKIGLDTIMPLKTFKIHVDDAPWVTAEFKALIKSLQKAFSFAQGDTERYRLLRNITNGERKLCRSKYYNNKVANLRTTKPSHWWKKVKMIAGLAPNNGGDDISSQLHLDGIADSSNQDIANLINTALLEPMQAYSLLAYLPTARVNSEILTVNSAEVCNALLSLNPRKTGGPDGINNWLLREFADLLASPLCDILNSSFAEQS